MLHTTGILRLYLQIQKVAEPNRDTYMGFCFLQTNTASIDPVRAT